MPITVKLGLSMFARCAGEFFQSSIVALADDDPAAMFSAT